MTARSDAGLDALLEGDLSAHARGDALDATVYVIPAARGHGLANRLTARLLERLRGLGLDTVQLEVVATNDNARAIYARWASKSRS